MWVITPLPLPLQSIGNRKFYNEGHSYATNTNLEPKDEGLVSKMSDPPDERHFRQVCTIILQTNTSSYHRYKN